MDNIPNLAEDAERWRSLESIDSNVKWGKGDLLLAYLPTTQPGRPDGDTPTLTDFAAIVNAKVPRLSEYRSCAAFYPPAVRVSEDYVDLSWSHFNAARKRCDGKLDNAEELLHEAVKRQLSADDFRAWLKDMKYPEDKLPSQVITMTLGGLAGIWRAVAVSLNKRGVDWTTIVEITVKVVK